jgi:hypothetical protein
MPIAPEEDILRAICTDKMDGEIISPSLFKGSNTSVSRPAIIPLDDHWEMFRRHVQKPPERLLVMMGELNVGRLQQIGSSYRERPTEISVEPKPEDWNPAHAEIPQNISRGLANKIIDALTLNRPSRDLV